MKRDLLVDNGGGIMPRMTTPNPNWFLKARLKTRQLLLMIALDEHRNIHRAAEELHMTQPAASKQLKDLEDMLDVKLFERLPRGMERRNHDPPCPHGPHQPGAGA